MTFKLIALDIDGTLLNDDHELTPATAQAVRAAADQGATIVLCTGRGPGNAIPVMQELGLEGTVITHNGAATISTKGLELLHEFPFPREKLAPFIDYCREHRVHYDLNTPFELYVDADLPEAIHLMYRNFNIAPVQIPHWTELQGHPVKFTVYDADQAVIEQVEADWMRFDTGLKVLRSGDYFIDIMHADASKGHALQKLAAIRGIEPKEILAIGNYYNDVDMLQFAGLGIAMENAPEAVKQAANTVTASNNDNGVAKALEKYVLAPTV